MNSAREDASPLLRRATLLVPAAVLLLLANTLRLFFLSGQHEWLFMDGFETFIALLATVACVFAAARCSRRGKEVWTVVTVYFVIMVIADFHDTLVDALPQS